MPKTIKPSRSKITKNVKSIAVVDQTPPKTGRKNLKRIIFAVLIIAVLALGIYKYKNWFVVAIVDGKPILRSELNQRLMAQYGSQTLEGLIGEKLIFENAAKQNITVSQQEIDDRIAEIEKTLNGMKIDEALKLQGMTMDDFVNRQKIQLTIDKMFNKDISVSATEVDDYIKNNAASLVATEAAQRLIEAEDAVKNSKIEQKFMEWFNKIKTDAKIFRFI